MNRSSLFPHIGAGAPSWRTECAPRLRTLAVLWLEFARRTYAATVTSAGRGRILVPVPFDPDEVWGPKTTHRVGGAVNGMGVARRDRVAGRRLGFVLGPAWRRDCGVGPGDEVTVVLEAEGPQRADLAPDVAAALEAEPAAGEFFDALAQFYRRAYLRWIDGTKRRPEVRPEWIVEMVGLLKAGQKERPPPA